MRNLAVFVAAGLLATACGTPKRTEAPGSGGESGAEHEPPARGQPDVAARTEQLEERVAELDRRIDRLEAEASKPTAAPNPLAKRRQRRRRRRPARPDPDTVYSVPVDDSAQLGPDDAEVTIVEAFEFACPYCHRVHDTIQTLRDEYGDKLRVVYKSFIVHPKQATAPALAACAAAAQDRYAEMVDAIWAKGFEDGRDLSESNMKKIARGLGLDMARFEQRMGSDACKDQLHREQKTMAKIGTRGTPSFYINGRPLTGAQPIQRFRALIDEELEKAEQRIEDGTPAADYYETWVVEKGDKSL